MFLSSNSLTPFHFFAFASCTLIVCHIPPIFSFHFRPVAQSPLIRCKALFHQLAPFFASRSASRPVFAPRIYFPLPNSPVLIVRPAPPTHSLDHSSLQTFFPVQSPLAVLSFRLRLMHAIRISHSSHLFFSLSPRVPVTINLLQGTIP